MQILPVDRPGEDPDGRLRAGPCSAFSGSGNGDCTTAEAGSAATCHGGCLEDLQVVPAGYGPRMPHTGFGLYPLRQLDSSCRAPDCNRACSTNDIDAVFPRDSTVVAFVNRGGCSFVTKSRVAQQAGALAVVIADTTNMTSRPFYYMCPPALNYTPGDVTIASFMVRTSQGNLLRSLFRHVQPMLAALELPGGDMYSTPQCTGEMPQMPWSTMLAMIGSGMLLMCLFAIMQFMRRRAIGGRADRILATIGIEAAGRETRTMSQAAIDRLPSFVYKEGGGGARGSVRNYSKFFKRVRGRSNLIGCRGACGGRAPIFFQFLPLYCATARRRMSSCWSRGEVATVSDTPGARREVGRSQGFL